jgi:hypothetical protein
MMIGLPVSRRFQKEIGFPEEGAVVGGFRVESVSVEHMATYADRQARYEYPTKIIVEGDGTVDDVKRVFMKFFVDKKTILTGYGNPYQCDPGKMYVQNLGENRFKIVALGSCVRVFGEEPDREVS